MPTQFASRVNRVLVVDDDSHTADGLRLLLELDGYEVVALRSSEEAIERLKSEVFDAVITDLEMPKNDGFVLLERVHAKGPATPVLVMTGYYGSPVCDQAVLAGAWCVLGKPIDYDQLAQELADSLTRLK